MPIVYATSEEYLAIPIDRVKPKSTDKLQRETNLARDPRAALLVEHWNDADWSKIVPRGVVEFGSASGQSQ